MSTAYGPETRESALGLMAYIVRLETAALARSARATTVALPSPPPSSTFRPIFREVQAGEQRTEGVLERIECSAGGAAVFHIRTTAGLFRATASRMVEVDFITYRGDLSGSVGCGPAKTPMSVYLTWRGGSAKPGANVAVKIEFLAPTTVR